MTFLDYIKEQGYDPMFYAAKNELTGGADWDTAQLSGKISDLGIPVSGCAVSLRLPDQIIVVPIPCGSIPAGER